MTNNYLYNNTKEFFTRYIFLILLNIYLFFVIFDGARESLGFLPYIISYHLLSIMRDITQLCLILIIFFCNKKIVVFGQVIIYLVLLIFAQLCLSTTIGIENFLLSLWGTYRISKSLLLFFILVNSKLWFLRSDKEKIKAVRYLVILSICLFFISLFIYYKYPAWIKKYQINRIGIGNQSLQSGIYFISFILCIHYQPFSKAINFIVSFIMIIAALLSVTSTAIIATTMALSIFFFDKSKRNIIILFFFFGVVFFILFIIYFSEMFHLMLAYAQVKIEEVYQLIIKTITFSNELTRSGSFRTRENQIKSFFDNLKPIEILFGSAKMSINYYELNIENLYIAILHDYGVIGLLILLIILIRALLSSVYTYIRKKEVIQIIAISSFIIYGMSLNLIAVFTPCAMFMVLFYLVFWENKKKMQ